MARTSRQLGFVSSENTLEVSLLLTISKMPVDFAALASPFSPSGFIILAKPVGQINSGKLTGIPRTVLEVSTTATSLITLGRNHIRLYMDRFISRVQQSVAAVE